MEAALERERSRTCNAMLASSTETSLTFNDQAGAAPTHIRESSAEDLKLRTETSTGLPIHARGSANWWLRRADNAAQAQNNRELQDTCIFALQQSGGRLRRLVKKLDLEDGNVKKGQHKEQHEEDQEEPAEFDDTASYASWQSWRSAECSRSGSFRLSRSASEASCHSTASGAFMQELLASSGISPEVKSFPQSF